VAYLGGLLSVVVVVAIILGVLLFRKYRCKKKLKTTTAYAGYPGVRVRLYSLVNLFSSCLKLN
jgi:hypothetical protein